MFRFRNLEGISASKFRNQLSLIRAPDLAAARTLEVSRAGVKAPLLAVMAPVPEPVPDVLQSSSGSRATGPNEPVLASEPSLTAAMSLTRQRFYSRLVPATIT